ncbi:MAG: sigma-70 family RNA polymerase sigma factor [Candidatus Poribacteria bacterium]|nr:sigma-70 family RNA polymerase sigma factor [Candidatus Poribacteria bacterium]
MKNDDAQLIQRVLDGDDTAFSALVKKYQKPVHALAWRKIGDFHIAEDITQDTFLKAYQSLSTLKEPQRFASWLYVIAANYCKMWLRKKRLWTQSLENTSGAQLEKATYSGYVIEEHERTVTESQREVVKKLLGKLQESERTVITLYYLGEMTHEEISEFLGVSVAAIKNRLYRARRRLKKEEPMIREALGNFQITPNLTESIMREVSRLKPVAPSGGKPLVPWAIAASTLAVVLFMLGVGSQFLSRFQKTYSFDATSEMTVEIVEAPVVLNLESKPDVRTQLGNAAAPSKNDGFSQQLGQPEYTTRFAAAQVDQTEEPTATDEGNRYIIFESSTHEEESAEVLASGRFSLEKTGEVLTPTGYGTTGSGNMLVRYILDHNIDLFRFPLVIGDTWTQKGRWAPQTQTTLVGYEKVEVAAGTFTDCLKHKTIFTNPEGTRYLWFAKGVGVVKMRYEHSNGVTTEAELLDYNVPKGEEYLPLQYGNMWTYKLQNEYREKREKPIIEKCEVVENSDQPLDSVDSKFFSDGRPKVRRIIPDLSEKVSIIIEDIRVDFSEPMMGVDIASASVPIGDLKWIDGGRTLIIPLSQPLLPSKTYRLILAEGYRNMAGVAFPEYTLTFTTEGPEPVTSTFVDTTPVYVADIEELNLSNELLCRVTVNPTEGFNFPYYLFIPQGIDLNKPVHLLVEPCNTGVSRTRKSLDRKTKALAEASHATIIAKRLKVPLLVPVFPRPGAEQWLVPVSSRPGAERWETYTHALDRDTLLIRDGDLKRIDLQLINMIAHAQRLLRHNNMKVNEKVFMNGFSASGTFTNRFAILHPTIVRAVATGGINSIPTFPTERWDGVTMRYPVGIADVKEIAGIEFNGAAYKRVSQYIYMGALDDNDTVPYRDAYDAVDADLVKSLIGAKMMPDRWDMSQLIYKALEIPAQFVTYENTGHQIKSEMIDDIVAFFKANFDDEIVKIVPHQYPKYPIGD